jgi:hypothetical protein
MKKDGGNMVDLGEGGESGFCFEVIFIYRE